MPSVLCVCGDAVKTHSNVQTSVSSSKIRCLRVAVRRQPEMMVVISHAENGDSAERRNEDGLNSVGLPLPEKLRWCQQSSCLHNGR
jgi:hypothetical protein